MNSFDFFWVRTIFITLNLTNLLIMWQVGKKLKNCRTDYTYWKNAIWIILSYSVVMGMRFGRLVDYNVYYDRYIGIGSHFSKYDYEFTFKGICWIMYNLGIPYPGFIWFTSVLLIFAVLFLIKDYKKFAPCILILFLWEAHNAELFIRWYIAFAFFLVAFVWFKHRHYAYAAFFAVLSVTSHVGVFVIVLLALVLSLLKRQILPSFLVEIIFLFNLLLSSVEMLEILNPYISLLGVDERSTIYTEKFKDIITGNFGQVGIVGIESITTYVRNILAYSFPILFLPILLKKNLVNTTESNIFLLGTMLFPILNQVEILNRYGEALMFFSAIVSSIAYYYIFLHRKQYPSWVYVFAVLSMISNIWPIISSIISRQDWWYMLFIWNAEGRNTLPIYLFNN